MGEGGRRVELRSEIKVSAERSHERGRSCEKSAHVEPDTAVKVKGKRGLRCKHGCLFGKQAESRNDVALMESGEASDE